MSKERNRKRLRLLNQSKQKLDLQNASIPKKDSEEFRLKYENENTTLIERSDLKKTYKVSTLVLEMIVFALKEARNDEDYISLIKMGVLAWNCGIIKSNFGTDEIEKFLNEQKENLNIHELQLLNFYIEEKCTVYGQYNELIIDYKLHFKNDGELDFLVVTSKMK